jgi:large subunit ribosomal protein L25
VAEIILNANIRTVTGQTAARKTRREGLVPGVFYLHNEKNIPIEVRTLDLRPLIYTAETHIVDLRLNDGTNEKCVLREVQFDPVTDKVVHFDLQGLVMTEKIRVEVPIVLEGSSPGVRGGGLLNHILHKIDVECLPGSLPEHISIDISTMQIGDIVTAGDIKLDNVVLLVDADQPVVTVTHSRSEAAEGEPGEAPQEPEVITRGKSDED